jgi:hypothetical protein
MNIFLGDTVFYLPAFIDLFNLCMYVLYTHDFTFDSISLVVPALLVVQSGRWLLCGHVRPLWLLIVRVKG